MLAATRPSGATIGAPTQQKPSANSSRSMATPSRRTRASSRARPGEVVIVVAVNAVRSVLGEQQLLDLRGGRGEGLGDGQRVRLGDRDALPQIGDAGQALVAAGVDDDRRVAVPAGEVGPLAGAPVELGDGVREALGELVAADRVVLAVHRAQRVAGLVEVHDLRDVARPPRRASRAGAPSRSPPQASPHGGASQSR